MRVTTHARIRPLPSSWARWHPSRRSAAIAKGLFDDAGPAGTVLLRVGFAALVLWLVWRPRPRALLPRELLLAATLGVALAGMNLAFYEALDRIPSGSPPDLEFVGPLGSPSRPRAERLTRSG